MLTINQVANLTNISIKAVRREVAAGTLKSQKIGSKYFISKNDFEVWRRADNITKSIFEPDLFLNLELKSGGINWLDISSQIQRIDGWQRQNDLNGFNFIDLFAGAGGMSCGLVMAGFTPVGSVEIMPHAVETYKYNFIKQKGFKEKIETRDIRENAVKDGLINDIKDKKIHLICGGFPCQGFSMAGNRIVDDERNSLYKEMLEIVGRIKPDFVLMENVEGLRSMLGGAVERKIIEDYAKIGYKINVATLNAADYGTPQIRKRVIFIGNRLGVQNFHPAQIYSPNRYKTVQNGIERFLNLKENKTINHEFTKHRADMVEKLQRLEPGKSLYKNYSDAWKRMFWDRPSNTVKENHGGVNVHPLLPRVMTARELAALQSFPDDFIFCGPKKWQLVQIGNAVPPLLAKAIGLCIAHSIRKFHE